MLANSGGPDEINIFLCDITLDIEELDQFTCLFDEFLIIVIEEEQLEQPGATHPDLKPIIFKDEVIFLASRQDMADAFQFTLEVWTADHLQGQF